MNWSDPGMLKRFWSKVQRAADDECWVWAGATTRHGYGVFVPFNEKHTTAHRVSFAIANGYEPEGLQVDHICRNRLCVNPKHLEAVTNQENTLRGLRGRMVKKCVNGHKYTPENTIVRSNGRRLCRECRKTRDRARRDATYWREYRKNRKENSNG